MFMDIVDLFASVRLDSGLSVPWGVWSFMRALFLHSLVVYMLRGRGA